MTKKLAAILCLTGIVLLAFPSGCSRKAPTVTRADRLKWNQSTLESAYHSVGQKNPKWDADATDALKEFARLRTAAEDEEEILSELVGDAADRAVSAGCDDALIKYLATRHGSITKAKKFSERQERYRLAAESLGQSSYPPIRKFFAHADAAEILWQQRDTNFWPVVRDFRNQAVADLNAAFADQAMPEMDAYQAAETLFQLMRRNVYELTNAYNTINATLASLPEKATAASLIKARFYITYAWRARGNGTADKVTEEGWRLFHERLDVAEAALNQAWSRDSHDEEIPVLMLTVMEGQSKPRAEMETWFQRAMKLEPNSYAACRGKLHFLLPQWYGSREDMVAFGRQCVAATNWNGRVPLILVDAHADFSRTLSVDERRDYWLRPEVWPDIQLAYEKFARLHPETTRFRYPYAAYAFRCGQWQEFLEQTKIIRANDSPPRYNYFGGEKEFTALEALAKERIVKK